MVEIAGTAQHEAWRRRELPPVEALDAGIWSVPVPIPDNPLRYTLSYVVPGTSGPVVVDPGWSHDGGWDALLAGLAEAGFTPGDVQGVVVTHVHPDHHGLSGRLREASGCWIAMHSEEKATLPHRPADPAARGRQYADWLRRHHLPEDEIVAAMAAMAPDGRSVLDTLVEPDVLLEDGDLVPMTGRRLAAVWTPGHTPGHICLVEPDAGMLLTGDHLLPRISPNIGLSPGTSAPLAKFLASLRKLTAYDAMQALPAHEYRFRGIAGRARAIAEHHEQRCAEILAVVDELGAPTMWQLAAALTWSRPWEQIGRMRVAAASETAAHVEYLADRGDLRVHGDPADGPVTVTR